MLTALGIGLSWPASVIARHISAEDALARVKNGEATTLSKDEAEAVRKVTGATRSSLTPTVSIGSLYVYSSEEGYIILPSYDEAPALLAYSDKNSFEADVNPEMRYWLDFYNAELSTLSENRSYTGATAASERPQRAPIAPLTKTKWNQEAPYNDLCPKVNGRGTVTGCVATAMAQVLKFHSYPAKGHGQHSYHWAPGDETLSFDYEGTTFDWDEMTNTYDAESSAEAKKAVATLMLACGISVDMHYDVGDSGASTMAMGAALIDYFGYDRSIWMPVRDYYGLYEWEDMVYSELEKGRPVLYSGQGTAGGHQFICDGYSSDGFFHFNWGWGGMSDGYFRLTALNPASLGVGGGAGGFNSGQQITLGVIPAVAGSVPTYLMYCTNHFLPKSDSVTAGQELRAEGDFYNYSLSALPDGSKMGMKIASSDGSTSRYEAGYDISGIGPLVGYGEDFIRFPELADGKYVITPAFYDGTTWHDVAAPVGAVGSIHAVVENNTATLTVSEASYVSVEEIEAPATIYKGRQFPLKFTVVNHDDTEFLGDVYPVLIDPATEKAIASSVYRPVDIEAGESERITDYIGKFTALEDEDFAPGEYSLVFRNHEGKEISEAVKITVEADPGNTVFEVTGFKLDGTDPVTDKENVKFTFAITCEEGYFSDELHLYIFPGDGGGDLASAASDMIYLPAGEKHYGAVTINLSHLEDGDYMACLYKGNKECTNVIRFTLATGDSGVETVTAGSLLPDETVIYDLNGVRRTSPLKGGIYIINGRKTIVR